MTIGDRIREARKKKGLTQRELGDLLGITAVGVAQWENGIRNPRLETRQRIAQALGMDFTDLMDDAEQESYFNTIGSETERVKLAATEVRKEIDKKIIEITNYGGTVSPRKVKSWVRELALKEAQKYHVGVNYVLEQFGLDGKPAGGQDQGEATLLIQYADGSREKMVCQDLEAISRLATLLELMNEAGRAAVLRHVQELVQIPSYRRNLYDTGYDQYGTNHKED